MCAFRSEKDEANVQAQNEREDRRCNIVRASRHWQEGSLIFRPTQRKFGKILRFSCVCVVPACFRRSDFDLEGITGSRIRIRLLRGVGFAIFWLLLLLLALLLLRILLLLAVRLLWLDLLLQNGHTLAGREAM